MSYSSYQRRSFQGRIDRQPQLNRYSGQNEPPYEYKPQMQLSSTSPLHKNINDKASDKVARNRYSSHQKQYQYDIGDAPRPRTPSNINKTVNIQNALHDFSLIENPISYTPGIHYARGAKSGSKQYNDSYSQYQSQVNHQAPFSQYSTNKGQVNNKRVYINDIDMNETAGGYGKEYQSGKISKGAKRSSKHNLSNETAQKRRQRIFDQQYNDKQNKHDSQFQTREQRKYESKDNSRTFKQNKVLMNIEKDQPSSFSKANKKIQRQSSGNQSFKNPQQDRRRTQNQRQIMKKISRINSLNQEINSRLQKMIAKMGSD